MEEEADVKAQLEAKTHQLSAELNALRSMEKNYGKMDRAKRKLEEEIALYRVCRISESPWCSQNYSSQKFFTKIEVFENNLPLVDLQYSCWSLTGYQLESKA